MVGTLVMAGMLKPADPLPRDPHLLSWGHLMPVVRKRQQAPRLSFTLPGWVSSVAFSPTNDRLAIASADKIARIVDPKTARERVKFQGHDDAIASVHFHPEGDWNRGGLVKLRDTATGKPVVRFQHTGEVLSLSFSRDGHTIAAGAADKSLSG